jgi:hypothetical protein
MVEMHTHTAHHRPPRPWWAICALGVALLGHTPVRAQETMGTQDPPPAEVGAAFEFHSVAQPSVAHESPADWTLHLDGDEADPPPEQAQDPPHQDWTLAQWAPPQAAETDHQFDAQFTFRPAAAGRRYTSLADYWARNTFSEDASQLTMLDSGQEVIGWHLGSGVTFSGVGSRRILTDRDRGFVLAAEAGLRLSPTVGFQIGYEVLRASAGGSMGNDLGAEAVFARFQFRF